MGKGRNRWESPPQMLKSQEVHKNTAPHPRFPSITPCAMHHGLSFPLLKISAPAALHPLHALLFKAALVLILACLLRDNMVMKLICVICLEAHPLLESL